MWDHMNDLGKLTMDSWLRFGQMTARNMQRMTQQQLAVTGHCLEAASECLRSLSEAKSLQDVLTAQTRFAMECSGKWMASAPSGLEASMQVQSELGEWMRESLDRLNSQVHQSVERAQETLQQAA